MSFSTANPGIQRILVVRLGAMGDVIHALPAVAALRALFPNAAIGWAVEERWAELLSSEPQMPAVGEKTAAGPTSRRPEMPLVDAIHLMNTRQWRSRLFAVPTWRQVRQAAQLLRHERYDLAVDFQGAWKSGLLARISGAPARVGFRNPREGGARMFYTHAVTPNGAHVVEQNISLVAALGASDEKRNNTGKHLYGGVLIGSEGIPPAPQLPLDPERERWAGDQLARYSLAAQNFAVINPGAGWGAKRWPPQYYAEVVRGLARLGLRSLVNYGPEEESLASAVVEASGGAAQALRSGISELIALMRRARLFIGGDTGPMHLAAALQIPVVAIFGPTDPARNGPFGTESIVLRSTASVTNHSRRADPDQAMLSITPGEVLEAAQTLLARMSAGERAPGEVQRG